MTDEQMLLTLRDIVNGTGILPATAALDYLADTPPAASVQQLAGTRISEPWVSGGGIGQTPFAVLLRVGHDTAARVSASSALLRLASELEEVTPEEFGYDEFISIKGETTPVLYERGEDGSEAWRAQYVLESVRRRATQSVS